MIPGVPARLAGRKPEIEALERNTVGAKLKRRRLQVGLRQKDASPQLGVSESVLVDWERGQTQPAARFYPAIIAFLGYEPWPEPVSVGDQLRAERMRRGWSVKRAARELGVDEGTFAGWERGRRPTGRSHTICDAFLASVEGRLSA